MTFDGLNSNIAVCKLLGADIPNKKCYIDNPHSDGKIFLFLDGCHMLKLSRNILARKKMIYDNNNKAIEWRFIENLEQYQRDQKINFGNKINKKHIQWDRVKMCVRVAAETMSNSVADAIDLLRSKGIEAFEHSEPMTRYLRMVNNTFDILNSKYDDAVQFKRTISRDTRDEYFQFIEEAVPYFESLKDSPNAKQPIIRTRSKAPFFGFELDFINFRSLYFEYVESGIILSIPTFRFSQDHLELLFACLRSMFGCNDNPSPRHLESAWRKLLGQHQIKASESANCAENDIEFLSVLEVSSRKKQSDSNVLADSSGLEFIPPESDETDDLAFLCSIMDDESDPNTLESHVISFTAATLQNDIFQGRWFKRLTCVKCLDAFKEDVITDDDFVNTKMKTKNLLAPARSTVRVCAATEKSMQKYNYQPGHLKDIILDVVTQLNLDSLFSSSDFDAHPQSNEDHKSVLVRMIIEMYVKKKMDYICKCNTLDSYKLLVRNMCRKHVHFQHQ